MFFFTRCLQVASINDKSDYRTVNEAMRAIGFKREHVDTLWRIVAAILHLVSDTLWRIVAAFLHLVSDTILRIFAAILHLVSDTLWRIVAAILYLASNTL